MARIAKPKIVKLEIVPRPDDKGDPPSPATASAGNEALAVEAYALMDRLINQHHPALAKAAICLAWMRGKKADKDGRLHLGRAAKSADLHRQLHEYDWIVILNREAFGDFTAQQRAALIDHELCHCRPATDKHNEQKTDAQGKLQWRCRKHDVEEFREVVERHGLWKADLETLYQAMVSSRKEPLLALAQATPKSKKKLRQSNEREPNPAELQELAV